MKRSVLAAVLALSAAAATGCGISTQQEVEMGASYAQQINSQLPIIQDPEVMQYINVIGDSLARVADERNLDWHFFVVNSPEVNAFAVPGGYIYVNRGLIERAPVMSQLAGVLGHEIGHVTNRHTVEQMKKEQGANIGLTVFCVLQPAICNNQAAGAAIQLGGGAIFAKFSRNAESEADASGVTYTTRAGINPNGIPEMFEILLEERRQRPAGVEAWFSTHPLEEDRIANTRALIAKIDPAIIATTRMDSQRYQEFRRRIASLPPAPPQRMPSGDR
ncbi:MAG TPA: M48 family metallopeptidase [Gemmatimonadaceae bacterium]|nr:M48 family metallopeptidase [Gemmatimonadaceae bacterium]